MHLSVPSTSRLLTRHHLYRFFLKFVDASVILRIHNTKPAGFFCENANLRLNADRRALYSRWQTPGDQVFFKAIDGNIYKTDTKESSRFVMDDNEFYFSTVNLSYRLEGKKYNWMKRAGISSATLGLYMEDICRFSTVKMERGIDYPFSRSVSMSLNVIF